MSEDPTWVPRAVLDEAVAQRDAALAELDAVKEQLDRSRGELRRATFLRDQYRAVLDSEDLKCDVCGDFPDGCSHPYPGEGNEPESWQHRYVISHDQPLPDEPTEARP